MSWLGDSAALAVLSFDVDAESAILAQGRRYADHAMVMTHQAYGPQVGVPRLLELLDDFGLKATFFVPGLTADRYPQTVERIAAAGHEVGHHSYSHRSPVDLGAAGEREDFERALAALDRVGVRPKGHRGGAVGGELGHAGAGRRVRARVRLDADGRRQAVPARDRPAARSPSCRRTGASTTGSSTPTCRGRRSASTSSRPRRCSTCGPTSSTRCAGTAACSCSPTTRSCPGARGGWRRCASSSSTRSDRGDVEFVTAAEVAARVREDPEATRRTLRPVEVDAAIYPEL